VTSVPSVSFDPALRRPPLRGTSRIAPIHVRSIVVFKSRPSGLISDFGFKNRRYRSPMILTYAVPNFNASTTITLTDISVTKQ